MQVKIRVKSYLFIHLFILLQHEVLENESYIDSFPFPVHCYVMVVQLFYELCGEKEQIMNVVKQTFFLFSSRGSGYTF